MFALEALRGIKLSHVLFCSRWKAKTNAKSAHPTSFKVGTHPMRFGRKIDLDTGQYLSLIISNYNTQL